MPFSLGEARELVGQADVDVAVGGLGELGQLGGLGAAEVPDAVGALEVGALVEVEDGLVELAGLGRTLLAEAADELGVLAQVGEDPAGEDPLGREDEVEVLALGEAGDLLEHRLPAGAGRADGQRRLVGDEGARGQVLGEGLGGGVHPAEVGLPGLVVDEERHDEDDGVGAGDRVGVVGRRAQLAGGHQLREALGELSLTGEGLATLVDDVDDLLVDIDTHDLVALARELDRERQSDLSEGDNRDLHSVTSFRLSGMGAGVASAEVPRWASYRRPPGGLPQPAPASSAQQGAHAPVAAVRLCSGAVRRPVPRSTTCPSPRGGPRPPSHRKEQGT